MLQMLFGAAVSVVFGERMRGMKNRGTRKWKTTDWDSILARRDG